MTTDCVISQTCPRGLVGPRGRPVTGDVVRVCSYGLECVHVTETDRGVQPAPGKQYCSTL